MIGARGILKKENLCSCFVLFPAVTIPSNPIQPPPQSHLFLLINQDLRYFSHVLSLTLLELSSQYIGNSFKGNPLALGIQIYRNKKA